MRRRAYTLVALVAFSFFLFFYGFSGISSGPAVVIDLIPSPAQPEAQSLTLEESTPALTPTPTPTPTPIEWEEVQAVKGGPPPKPMPSDTAYHPIQLLTEGAQSEFEALRKRQSKTLDAAVKEYRMRYGLPPPPHFDKWFEFAQNNSVQMIDEFDTIYDLITPFWGLQPKTIRARAKEALGFDNGLVGVAIRGHEVTHIENGQEWQQNATKGMMEKFIQYLPDMDLAFNIHDEPRVVVPYGDLNRLVQKAKATHKAVAKAATLANNFSPRPRELNDGTFFEETKLSRFNVFPHQPTWTNSRLSCPPDSPARILDDERADDLSKYGIGELGFIYNTTAMSDICNTPSLGSTYGFFDRPNTFKVVHDLFPIFSQSKVSSYGDIIYPSPWYWYDKVAYDESRDMPWEKKQNKLYWRGSTTGGFSRSGGWRRQHRQQFVQKINSVGQAKVMANDNGKWEIQEVPRGNHRELIDVHFSHVGQCDDGDCNAQKQFFTVTDRVDQQDAWGFRHLLDIDGNAFSGRFYAFLQSQSLTFKLALFREWHGEWLKPWVHFVPLSLQGDEWLEAVRYFGEEDLGVKEAQRIAKESSEWANKVVRKEDMEAWFFRLLLEYGRVIDDNRESIGFGSA